MCVRLYYSVCEAVLLCVCVRLYCGVCEAVLLCMCEAIL